MEALHQLVNQNAIELVATQKSLGFCNRLFLLPKPINWWRPILDLSTLNTFLNTESFKIQTPETIRTSLQAGEWVTSIDFKKRILPHTNSQSVQEVHAYSRPGSAQEVKLMALQKGIRINQYLDDWLVRATSHQTCLQHTQTLIALCRGLGWLVNEEKSTGSKTGFQLHRLPVRTERGQGQTHTRALTGLNKQGSDNIVRCVRSGVSGLAVHIPHRSTRSNRKATPPRLAPYEIYTVAIKKQLEGTRVTRKGDTSPQGASPSLKMVVAGKQCASRSAITPTKTCSADLYR